MRAKSGGAGLLPARVGPGDEPLEQVAWVQRTLVGLRRALSEQWERADRARLATVPDETDTVVDRFDDIPIGLPPGCRVQFKVGPNDIRDYIAVRVANGGGEVHAGGPMVSSRR